MPAPVITRIQPIRPRSTEVFVHLDRGEPLRVMLEALEQSRLGVGDVLEPTRRHTLLNDDADARVREAAIRLIAYRSRTRVELRRRLRAKGFPPARVERCLDRLESKGLIDDEAVAAAFVRDRLRHRPRGRAALNAELRAKGLSRDAAERAIDGVFDDTETDDGALALEVAEQWVARQGTKLLRHLVSEERSAEREKARRRLRGYLGRRGFRGGAATAAVDHAIERARRRSESPG